MLEAEGISWSFLDEIVPAFEPDQIDGADVVVVGGATVTPASLAGERPPRLFARLGAGYDTVPVDDCTAKGILVTTAPDGVRRAMASAGIALTLALAHRLVEKNARTHAGIWDRSAIGTGLLGRTLGVLGVGNIGRDLCQLSAPFGWRRIAHDKYSSPPAGVESVDFDTLMGESDYLVVTLPLTDETHHIVDARALSLMKRSAYLVNIARGPVVDQQALTAALSDRRIAGAALDVFEQEPLADDDPLLRLDNVLLTGHDIGLTLDMTGETGRSACRSIIEFAHGRVPEHLLNRAVLDHPRLVGQLR
jgi:D-3-phosphoglycerate dehydrogenase